MCKFHVPMAAFTVVLVLSPFAAAHVLHYAAILDGLSQDEPNASPGLGTALVSFNHDTLAMRIKVEFSGLTGTVTEAHIHAATEHPLEGVVDPATQVPTFPNFPAGVTSGTYDATFSMAHAASYNPAFIAANGGTVSGALSALSNGLDHGRAYLNIHTSLFPEGEIRGFLINLEGDFNHNLVVDAADYAVWRDSYDQIGEGMHADANHDNRVDEQDYDAWLRNFGRAGFDHGGHHHGDHVSHHFGSISPRVIPEPGWCCLLFPALSLLLRTRRFRGA